MSREDRERVLQQAMMDAIEDCLPLRFGPADVSSSAL